MQDLATKLNPNLLILLIYAVHQVFFNLKLVCHFSAYYILSGQFDLWVVSIVLKFVILFLFQLFFK